MVKGIAGDAQQAELHTAGRTWIVLWASGVALVAGLLLIYVPASRRPATLLVVGIGLLAAGLIAPEPTLLLAQAAGLGGEERLQRSGQGFRLEARAGVADLHEGAGAPGERHGAGRARGFDRIVQDAA